MKLWKENLISQEYEKSPMDICEEFITSKFNKDVANLVSAFNLFIADRDGLNSTMESADQAELTTYLYRNYMDKVNYYNQ